MYFFFVKIVKVPGWFYIYLICKSNDDKYDVIRWSLFDWMFDFGQRFKKSFQNLQKRNLAVVLVTLKYLLQVTAPFSGLAAIHANQLTSSNLVNVKAARRNQHGRSRCLSDYGK